MTVREFAGALGIAPASASLIVSDLSRNGFIVRREDTQDLRRRILSVARDHERSVYEFRRSRATVVERALQGASDRDRATLMKLLRAIAQTSEATDTSAPRES